MHVIFHFTYQEKWPKVQVYNNSWVVASVFGWMAVDVEGM